MDYFEVDKALVNGAEIVLFQFLYLEYLYIHLRDQTESKGSIPLEFRRAIGDRIYGCDACLDACPWNRHAQESREATFQARETVFSKSLRDFLALTDDEFRALFAKSPIKRIKRPAFLRNVCVALGNVGKWDDLPALAAAAADPHPLIAEHAAWAIAEIRQRHSG